MADSVFLDIAAQYGAGVAVGAYFFWRYDKRTQDIIDTERQGRRDAEGTLKEARTLIDKQADAQHAMIQAQAKIIEDLRNGKAT